MHRLSPNPLPPIFIMGWYPTFPCTCCPPVQRPCFTISTETPTASPSTGQRNDPAAGTGMRSEATAFWTGSQLTSTLSSLLLPKVTQSCHFPEPLVALMCKLSCFLELLFGSFPILSQDGASCLFWPSYHSSVFSASNRLLLLSSLPSPSFIVSMLF